MHHLPYVDTMKEIFAAIQNADRIAIGGHINPDGDCLGATYALGRICEQMGKQVDFYSADEPSGYFSFIPRLNRFTIAFAKPNQYDLMIVVDTGVLFRSYARNHSGKKPVLVVIDHHISTDYSGDINLVDQEASSICELLAELCFELCPQYITSEVATAFFMGLSTDTGHFMREKNSHRCFAIATKLLECGAEKEFLVQHLFRNNSLEAIKCVGMLLSRITVHDTIMRLRHTQSELAAVGLDETHVELVLMLLTSIHHSGPFILFKLHDQEAIPFMKCSMRCANDDLDVARLAEQFGGGGHKASSGAKFPLHLPHAAHMHSIVEQLNTKTRAYITTHNLPL